MLIGIQRFYDLARRRFHFPSRFSFYFQVLRVPRRRRTNAEARSKKTRVECEESRPIARSRHTMAVWRFAKSSTGYFFSTKEKRQREPRLWLLAKLLVFYSTHSKYVSPIPVSHRSSRPSHCGFLCIYNEDERNRYQWR